MTMDQQMVAIHEIYLSCLKAGFDKDQALQVTLKMIELGARK